MFSMVIITCLAVGGGCQETRIQVDGLYHCSIHGQFYITKWLKQHPWRVLKKWKCDTTQSAKV